MEPPLQSNSETSSPPVQTRLGYIDALRGLAALLVVVYHVSLKVPHLSGLLKIMTSNGCRGVQLFYLISGLTLFISLDARKQSGKPLTKKDFFLRRFFRVAPLFYFSLIFYYWLYGTGPRFTTGNSNEVSWINLLSNITFLNGFSPYFINSIVPVGWSVAVEMQFYLLVPLLFSLITSLRRAIGFTIFAIILSAVGNTFFHSHVPIPQRPLWDSFTSWWLINQLPVFGFGIIAFFLLKKTSAIATLRSAAFLFGITVIAVLAASSFYETRFSHLLFAALFLPLVLSLSQYPSSLVVNRLLIYCGRISYSIYLLHTAFLHFSLKYVLPLASNLNPTNQYLLLLMVVVGLTSVASTVTYRLIELPGLVLGRNVEKYGLTTRALTSPWLEKLKSLDRQSANTYFKNIAVNLSLLGFASLISVGFCEVALKIVQKQSDGKEFNTLSDFKKAMLDPKSQSNQSDEEGNISVKYGAIITPNPNDKILYELKPNLNVTFTNVTVRTNSFGMRGPEVTLEKPENTYRIALLGDSFAFGWGVNEDQNFASVMQKNLNALSAGEKVEILNFGTPGYSTFQEVEQFKLKGINFKPDAVLVFFIHNDFDFPFFVRDISDSTKLIKSSALFHFGSQLFNPLKATQQMEERGLDPNTAIRELDELTKKNGIKLFFVINPRKDWRDLLARLPVVRNSESIQFLDIGKQFGRLVKEGHLTDQDLNLPHDPHPTPLRHKMYGDLMTPYFAKELQLQ